MKIKYREGILFTLLFILMIVTLITKNWENYKICIIIICTIEICKAIRESKL